MRKLFYFTVLVAVATMGNVGIANAQLDYKKKYHINEDFANNVLPTKPSTWIVRATNGSNESTNPPYGGAAGVEWKEGKLVLSVSGGGGNRGAEITFPTPQANPDMTISDTVWMELDWTITSATIAERNALGLIFMDSLNTTSNPRPIFGLYMTGGDGFIHYWNLDLLGPETSVPGEYYGSVFTTGQGGGGFRRAGAGVTDTLNASTRTGVTYAEGNTYHITVGLNFATKRVAVLTITQADDTGNTQTINDQPFIDEAAATLGSLATVNTRGNNTGTNGNTITFNVSYDNLEVYMLALSLGKANATVNYKDQDGAEAKPARVAENLEIGEFFNLVSSDKERFTAGGNYYAYNEEATHAANASKGDDGESVEVAAGGVSLDVIFKKTAATAGTYVWTGATGPDWDELQANFSVNNGAAISYQAGNAVAFSETDASNKEVSVTGIMDLGEQSVTISAPDYSFSGTGRITGTGVINADVATTIGFDNRLDGGLVINTTDPVILKHRAAAKTYKTSVANATLKLQTVAGREEPIPVPVEGAGGAINIVADSIAPHSLTVTDAPVVNLKLNQAGRLNGTHWTTAVYSGSTFEKGTQVNVTTDLTEVNPTGFGVASKVLDSVKVNLGDNVRLIRDYNEAAAGNDVIYIGELSGSASSYLEGGWIDGRAMIYNIGSLGTDAVFDGSIRPYQTITAATDTTEATTTVGNSGIRIVKVGAGKWTVNGVIDLPNSTINVTTAGVVNYSYNYITVQEGTLVLNKKVNFPENDTITHQINVKVGATLELGGDLDGLPAVNQSTLTVDSGGVLKSHNIHSSLRNTYIYGTLDGGISVPADISFYANAVVKLNVNNFTEGNYEQIDAQGDITATGGTLDITVQSAAKDATAQLLKFGGNPDIQFEKILVNGEDITENTAETPGAKLYFDRDLGELVALDDFSGIVSINVNKPIKSVQYFDLLGRPVSKDSKGFIIKNVTYTDNTKAVQKVYIRER